MRCLPYPTPSCGAIWTGVMTYMHEFYFESAAMILTLITVGKMLEARSKGENDGRLEGLDEAGRPKRRLSCGTERKRRFPLLR